MFTALRAVYRTGRQADLDEPELAEWREQSRRHDLAAGVNRLRAGRDTNVIANGGNAPVNDQYRAVLDRALRPDRDDLAADDGCCRAGCVYGQREQADTCKFANHCAPPAAAEVPSVKSVTGLTASLPSS